MVCDDDIIRNFRKIKIRTVVGLQNHGKPSESSKSPTDEGCATGGGRVLTTDMVMTSRVAGSVYSRTLPDVLD